MSEKKYIIRDNKMHEIIAANMTLDIALLLIKGYVSEHYNRAINLTISQMIETEENA